MKKIISLLLFCFFISTPIFSKNEILQEFGFFNETNIFKTNGIQHTGIKINLGGEYFSLYYLFSIGYTFDGDFHRHLPLGFYLVTKLKDIQDSDISKNEETNDSFGVLLTLIMLILPDGADFSIPIAEYFKLTPYFSWGGLEFNAKGHEELLVSWGAGLRLIFMLDDFCIGPYVGFKGLYKTDEIGFVFGLNVGWQFGK